MLSGGKTNQKIVLFYSNSIDIPYNISALSLYQMILAQLIDWSSGPGLFQTAAAAAASVHRTDTKALSGYGTPLLLSVS